MNNFLNELSNYLKNNINHNNGQVPLLNHILSDNKLTTANENCLRDKFDETLIQFAKDNFKNDTMYFVKDNKKSYWSNNSKQYNNDVYTVLKPMNPTSPSMQAILRWSRWFITSESSGTTGLKGMQRICARSMRTTKSLGRPSRLPKSS